MNAAALAATAYQAIDKALTADANYTAKQVTEPQSRETERLYNTAEQAAITAHEAVSAMRDRILELEGMLLAR